MILAYSLILGFIVGFVHTKLRKQSYRLAEVKRIGVLLIAVLPQVFVFQWNLTRSIFPNQFAAIILVLSQMLLLIFCLLNLQHIAFWLLLIGTTLNLIVISANGGFMPISPEHVLWLRPDLELAEMLNMRFGYGKDIVLPEAETRFLFLSDYFRFEFMNKKVMYSIGDVFLAFGGFIYMLGINLIPNVKKS